MNHAARDPTQEALAALGRLLQRQVITQEQAQAAARLITGDPALPFPPPPAPAAAPPPAPASPEPGAAEPGGPPGGAPG